VAAQRDRDTQGRPKNARPRDALGRPLPRGSENQLGTEEPPASPEEALQRGIEQFNAGLYFQAHESWEEGWHPSPEPERDFWQGLAQLAVGMTHRQRGNAHGAATLLRRGAKRLRPYGDEYLGVVLPPLVAFAEHAADRIENEGTDAELDVPAVERRAP
jgi:predicted metal-dependent hydrolase